MRRCLHDVISHAFSAGLCVKGQANLEAEKGLQMLWLLFLTPGPMSDHEAHKPATQKQA